MKNKLKSGSVHPPFCVATEYQTQGRGRRHNDWQSAPGKNILCSFLVSTIQINQLSALSNVASLAVAQTLENFGVRGVEIKWPNDVFAGNKKVAGILIENMVEQQNVKHAIIGIGINVNQEEFEGVDATSIKNETGRSNDIRKVLNYLYKSFYDFIDLSQVDLLRGVNFQLYKKDKLVTFKGPNGLKEVRVKQVLANGNLQVVENGNELHEYQFHTHQWIVK